MPRSYWVALTITFVMKPDWDQVFSRALLRALGTVAGLVVAAVVLALVPLGWWDVPVMFVLGPLIPVLGRRGYGYQTAAVTPVILLLSDVLNHLGTALLVPRLADSLIGCAIALVAGYLLWPESWHTRVGDHLGDTVGGHRTLRGVRVAGGRRPRRPRPDAPTPLPRPLRHPHGVPARPRANRRPAAGAPPPGCRSSSRSSASWTRPRPPEYGSGTAPSASRPRSSTSRCN